MEPALLTPGESTVDAQEIRKVEAYLKRLFSNARIRVVARPKKDDSAEIYIGDEFIGEISIDDEDAERSYNFQMAINAQEIHKVEAYLKGLFSNARIRVVARPRKQDSAEIYIGDEFIGVLSTDDDQPDRSYHFNMAILGIDLD